GSRSHLHTLPCESSFGEVGSVLLLPPQLPSVARPKFRTRPGCRARWWHAPLFPKLVQATRCAQARYDNSRMLTLSVLPNLHAVGLSAAVLGLRRPPQFKTTCRRINFTFPHKFKTRSMKTAKNTICLWYDGAAEEAARFTPAPFPIPR